MLTCLVVKYGVFARLLLPALLVGLPLIGVAATPCLYRGLDADTRVINRSGEISTPFPSSLSSNDCSRLRVANGTVVVYVVSPGMAQLSSKQVSRGPLMPPSDATGLTSTDPGDILKQIVVVLEGISRTKTGSSRGAEGNYLVASLPTGKLAEPSVDLSLALGPSPDRNLVSFELLAGAKLVYRQTGPSQWIKLPVGALKAGAVLRWKLDYADIKYEGLFKVEPADKLDLLRQSLQKDVQGDADELVEKLRVASGLNLEGYGWDARALISAALTAPQSMP